MNGEQQISLEGESILDRLNVPCNKLHGVQGGLKDRGNISKLDARSYFLLIFPDGPNLDKGLINALGNIS